MNFDLENLSSFAGWERLAETGMAFGTNLVAALAIFFVGRWIASRLVILMKAALTRAKVDRTLVSFLGNVANIGLIILFRPFKVGDYIKVNGFEGTVSEIKMVQTALSTPDNEEIILPNSVVMSNSIVNRSSMPLCRVQVVVGVDYACDLKAAKAAVLKAATEHPLCVQTQGKEAVTYITNLADSAIEITLWAWTNEADLGAFRFGLNEQVVENLRAANINIPFPQRDVHIIQQQG